jgi:hypothetical protein
MTSDEEQKRQMIAKDECGARNDLKTLLNRTWPTSLEQKREALIGAVKSLWPRIDAQEPTPNYNVTLIIIGAFIEGPDVDRVAQLTGLRREYVDEIATRFRASRLWTKMGTDYNGVWGGSGLVMDLLVGEGAVFPTRSKKDGRYVYRSLIYEGRKTS